MKTIGAAEFKTHCLEILDNVGPDGIVITKRGKPVARLIALRGDPRDYIGVWKGDARTDPRDDLLSTGITWEAEEGKLDGLELPILTDRAGRQE